MTISKQIEELLKQADALLQSSDLSNNAYSHLEDATAALEEAASKQSREEDEIEEAVSQADYALLVSQGTLTAAQMGL
ncbi:MAG: hypothetical protein ACRBCK_09965 [Alphaproteobacteria bacterium]